MINIYHYKERNPEDTIKIITNFFNHRNLKIQELQFLCSEINTYSCRFGLFLNNKQILATNGKGVTPELARASGLAELYERFCYYNYYTCRFKKIYKDIIQKQNNLKLITFNDVLQDQHCYTFLNKILPELNEQYFNIFFDKKLLYGNKFQNLNQNTDIVYKNIRLLSMIIGSNGLSAGNSLEEALVQGCCELYEREFITDFCYNKITNFYQLNINNLDIQYQQYVQQLQNKNIEVTIYDCSYYMNTPVIMIILFDKNNHTFSYDFGSHPIFNIALERCFTEVFQGYILIENSRKYQNIRLYQQNTCTDIGSKFLVSSDHLYGYINQNVIFNSKIVETYNTNVFISNINNDITNIDLLNYIKLLNLKNKKIYYYADLSLTSEIFTTLVIQNDLTQIIYIDKVKNIHLQPKKTQINLYILMKQLSNFYEDIIENKNIYSNNILEEKIYHFFELLSTLTDNIDDSINLFLYYWCLQQQMYDNGFILSHDNNSDEAFYLLLDILFQKNNIKEYLIPERHQYELYQLIKSCFIRKFSKEQIQTILHWLHYDNINLNFKLQDMDKIWFINKIFFEPLYDLYHSKQYNHFINIFGPDDNFRKEK